jgi:hypothetical protein
MPLSITLPPASVTNEVDIALLLDGTQSYVNPAQIVKGIFNDLLPAIQAALPGADLAFGVAEFKDFGGPGSIYSTDLATSRPYILVQPMVTVSTAAAADASLNSLIGTALSATFPGFGGDTPEADIEALYQLATGAGFDGNGNGSTLDSGQAGSISAASNPGSSGDVPPFSSNVGLTSGSLGGIGWRPGAEHIVILATDTAPVASFAGTSIPATITGLGGVSVPSTAFESTQGRVGFDSTVVGGMGTGPQPPVEPLGGATVQQTITALNNLGIKVISMGPDAAPTSSTAAALAPSPFFSALGRLTGTVDPTTGEPFVLSDTAPESQLVSAIVNSVKGVAGLPVNITLSPDSLPSGLTFAPAPATVSGVGPGRSATFNVTLNVGSVPYSGAFSAEFVDAATGNILGTIPFQINLPGASPPDPLPTPDPSPSPAAVDPPTVTVVTRLGRHFQPTSIFITYSGPMNAASVQNVNNYVLTGPSGGIVAIASATYDPGSYTVTLSPKTRVNFHHYYTLEIKGQGPTAVMDTAGIALDGMDTGQSGSNYYGKLLFHWVHPTAPPSPTKTGSTAKKATILKGPAHSRTTVPRLISRKTAVKVLASPRGNHR